MVGSTLEHLMNLCRLSGVLRAQLAGWTATVTLLKGRINALADGKAKLLPTASRYLVGKVKEGAKGKWVMK